MFTESIKTLYLGKSKLAFDDFGANTQIGKLAKETGLGTNRLPDLFIEGKLHCSQSLFITEISPEHILYITGIPLKSKSLDPYRLQGCIWSSYYQDSYRGYLFQITRIDQDVKLINNNKN